MMFDNGKNRSLVAMGADPAAVAAAEGVKARIQSAYIMAYQKPRDADESRARILKICKSPEFASAAKYSKPVGGTSIVGPSIRFAEMALREWGNILSDVQLIYEDEAVRRIRVSVLDLETNAQFGKDITIQKTVERRSKKGREEDVLGERENSYGKTVFILRATDDEMAIKEAAHISKVLRNEGLRIIPADIKSEAMRIVDETLRNRKGDPEQEKKKLLDAFASIGVYPKELAKYLGHSVDTVSRKELDELRPVYSAIRDGESSWNDYIAEREADRDEEKARREPPEYKVKTMADIEKPAGEPEQEPDSNLRSSDEYKALQEAKSALGDEVYREAKKALDISRVDTPEQAAAIERKMGEIMDSE